MFEVGETLLERYRLDGVIGGGGMGRIFSAFDLRTGKACAVKQATLPEDPADQEVARGMFKRELKSLTMLDDPGIVRLFDFGNVEAGAPFIVTERLLGRDLSALDDQRLSERVIVGVALKVLRALVQVHAAGIVHRDIKPSNVFLCDSGRVVLLDFGVARGAASTGRTLAQSYQTSVIGTAAYLAPEHLQGEPMQAASDVFALGGTLFTLAAGRPPFEGDGPMSVVEAILRDERPALTELRNGLSARTLALVEAMLDFDVGTRVDTKQALVLAQRAADELGSIEDALVQFAASHSSSSLTQTQTQVVTQPPRATATQPRLRRPRWWIPTALASLCAAPIGLYFSGAATLPQAATATMPQAATATMPQVATAAPVEANELLPAPTEPSVPTLPTLPTIAKEEPGKSAPRKGQILIALDRWAEVIVDGKSLGEREGSAKLSLTPGAHTLIFKNPKYPPKSVTIDVLPGQNTPIAVDIAR